MVLEGEPHATILAGHGFPCLTGVELYVYWRVSGSYFYSTLLLNMSTMHLVTAWSVYTTGVLLTRYSALLR